MKKAAKKLVAKLFKGSKAKDKPAKQAKPAGKAAKTAGSSAKSAVASSKASTPTPAAAHAAAPEGKTKGKKGKNIDAALQAAAPAENPEPEVVLTNAEGKQYCRVHDCDIEATTNGLCRLHYLAYWKRNKLKTKILQGGKLDKYIEDLTAKYPDRYLEMLRKDLTSEKDFSAIVAEMDVEDSGDEAEQEEEANRFIEEVRGGIPTTSDDDEGGF